MDKKRLLIAIIFGLVCIGIGYLIYRVFFYQAPAVPQQSNDLETGGQFPQTGNIVNRTTTEWTTTLPTAEELASQNQPTQTTIPVLEKQIVDATLNSATEDLAGGAKFYNQLDGKFYRVDENGKVQAMDDQVFYSVQKVTWSPTQNAGILQYPDGSKIYYNFDTKEKASLPKHWEEFSFSPQGSQVAAKSLGLAPENRWLVTSDPNGQNIALVEPMGENGDRVNVSWSPNNQIIATSLTGQALGDDRQEVLFVGKNHENFKSTIVEGRDFRSAWSPQGQQLLYSIHSERSNFKPELWVVDASPDSIGSDRRMLGINTWADKCTFADERYIYCAVPTTLETGSGFAPALADNTPDDLYKIDLQTNLKTQLPINGQYTINSVFLGNDGKTLYYTSKNITGLFSVALK